ncbi:MAG: hypothetical protein KAS17_02795 [Victivallaceae bacterium]|nr:hypothetical protein [Victivallaceae bacterium]
MKRTLITLLFVNLLILIIVATIFKPGDFNKKLIGPQDIEFYFILWMMATMFGVVFFNIYCFYNWGMTQFISKNVKKNWLGILLISFMFSGGICSLVYYILVVEMKRGLASPVLSKN